MEVTDAHRQASIEVRRRQTELVNAYKNGEIVMHDLLRSEERAAQLLRVRRLLAWTPGWTRNRVNLVWKSTGLHGDPRVKDLTPGQKQTLSNLCPQRKA